ncbi:3',5'-cyclic-AMP phosphodiesterase [Pleionea sp. CnH1-48]|uniref:3',5'-cyclic-AMP phosphodiesterase n=1 Tax=Pleionea sp. CnH1-48 TaxID=2954494 RepID=UPI002097D28E|nr:3',5'-cyclic-AMP phosphodiesterase [Pleionea sp. CnH1-48]MCO7227410.1 3',5'-cyclic-AMP phosphodiesterase [Pleionea sp. CnH1-48]
MSQVTAMAKQLNPMSTECLRIVQVTDPHIFAEPEGKLLGLSTRVSFEAILARIQKEEIAPDLLLATGDLSQDASEPAYQYLLDKFHQLNYPCFWVPGNHDDADLMEHTLVGQNVLPHKRILTPHWQIVLLNSVVKGKVYGNLAATELEFLSNALKEFPERHLMVVLHHQPVNVGSSWLDKLGLRNADELFEILAQHEQKTSVIWGHVHQDFEDTQNDIQLIATPSTCVQFARESEDFAAGQESPGYRYLNLYNDGRIESWVHRVDELEYTVDYTIKGY